MLTMSGRMQAGTVSHARPPRRIEPDTFGRMPNTLGRSRVAPESLQSRSEVTPESLRRFRGRTRAGRHPQNAACSRVRCGRHADTHLRVPSTRETRGVAALLSEGSRSIQVASTYADAHARAHARGGMQYCERHASHTHVHVGLCMSMHKNAPRCEQQSTADISRSWEAPATRKANSSEGPSLGPLERQRLSLKQGPVRPSHYTHIGTDPTVRTPVSLRSGELGDICSQGKPADRTVQWGASASASLPRAWRSTLARYRDTRHRAPARRVRGRRSKCCATWITRCPSGWARCHMARHSTPGQPRNRSG